MKNCSKKFSLVLAVLICAACFTAALQQYAGAFAVQAYNGTTNSSNFQWIINDESEPINVSVSMSCRSGAECDYLKYVTISPMRFELQPGEVGVVTVTASVPGDSADGAVFSGYLFGKKESAASGQVTIQLQVGKIVEVRTAVKKIPVTVQVEQAATPVQPTPGLLDSLLGPSSPFLALVMLVLVIALVIALTRKKGKKHKYKK